MLSKTKEEMIIAGLQQCAKCAWPCDGENVKVIVKTYLDSDGRKTIKLGMIGW